MTAIHRVNCNFEVLYIWKHLILCIYVIFLLSHKIGFLGKKNTHKCLAFRRRSKPGVSEVETGRLPVN